jgi:hypothetical protein
MSGRFAGRQEKVRRISNAMAEQIDFIPAAKADFADNHRITDYIFPPYV